MQHAVASHVFDLTGAAALVAIKAGYKQRMIPACFFLRRSSSKEEISKHVAIDFHGILLLKTAKVKIRTVVLLSDPELV